MPVVDAQGLVRTYGTHVVLDHIDLTIRSGERVGLLGDNGSGKSTLGKVLAGVEPPDAGELHYRRGAKVAYLAQAPDVPPSYTAEEAVLSGLPQWLSAKQRHDQASATLAESGKAQDEALRVQAEAAADLERHGGWDLSHRAQAMLGHLGITDPSRVVGNMSGGEQRRVALAKLLLSQPDLAVLDEPTNHLDVETIEWLERYLQGSFTGAVLLITHDRYVLDRVAQRTLELSDGKVYAYAGGYADYLEGKAEREAHEARAEANRQNFLRREIEWLRRGPKARGTKQKARIERAHEALAVNAPKEAKSLDLELAESRSGKTVLELHHVTLKQGNRVLVRDLDLYLTKGDRMGIMGPNGAGKTTLLRAILGEHPCASGEIVLGKNVDAAYLSQSRDGLDLEASILENVSGGRLSVEYGGKELDVRGYLQRFYFDPHRQRQPVGSLSGGERTRVAIAKLLVREANLVILDEPTNDLDVSTLSSLEDMLCAFGGTVLVVTHDRYFLDRVATSVLATEGDAVWTRYAGNYTDYLAQRPRPESKSAARDDKPAETDKSKGKPKNKPKSGLTYGERLELEALPEKIDEAEKAVAALQEELADPELYKTRGDEVAGLQAQLAEQEGALMGLMERWEQLEEKQGAS